MRLRRVVEGGIVSVVAMAMVGCSTAYMPQPGPRLLVDSEGGSPAYVREGRVYEGGMFGGDIVESVSGNPEAEEYARSYKNGTIEGFVLTMVGVLSLGTGFGLYLDDAIAHTGRDGSSSTRQIGTVLLAGGLAAYITGLVFMLNAQPRMFDAINRFNDGVAPGVYPYASPYSSPYAPPPAVRPVPATVHPLAPPGGTVVPAPTAPPRR